MAEEGAGATQWRHGLFGCFDNCTICIITYFVPCVTAGKVAEKVGESCILHGFLSMLGCIGIFFMAKTRQKIREERGIEGSFGKDCLCLWFCTLCALVQEAQEVEDAPIPGGAEMARD